MTVRSLNTTTKTQVQEVVDTIDALRVGLNEFDSDLAPEQRACVAAASQALDLAGMAAASAKWQLGRVEQSS